MQNTDIATFAKSIWETMMGLMIDEADLGNDSVAWPDHELNYIGQVQVTGGWQGAIVLQCSQTLARRAAARMFQCPIEEIADNDIVDVVGELANMIGGNLKALLPGPSQLSTPEIKTQEPGHPYVPTGSVVTQVTLGCEEALFRVMVLRFDD